LDGLLDALSRFAALLTSDAAKARTTSGLLLRGDAGQGKTHLFCDAGKRLLDQGHPALVILGSRFRGPGPWRDLSEHVGLGDVGSEALIGAMAAAAEAAGRPFVLLIDALNESRDPQMWLDELPAMISAAAASAWLAVGFSYRSSFEEVIVREEGIGDCAQAEHRGFEGREVEAAESFFEHFGLEAPQVPLLIPEFTNPLFLKLYCEGNGDSRRGGGEESIHLSDVFASYLEAKERAVCLRLKIDSHSAPVKAALELLAARMIESHAEYVPYRWATEALTALAPAKHEWPDTVLGALLSEGVLSRDLAWSGEQDDYEEVVRLSYQRLSDYRIADALLAGQSSAEDLRRALAPGTQLRERIETAPVGWIEALSVRVPELFGVELLAASEWRLDEFGQHRWERAFIASIASRRPTAVGERTVGRIRELAGSPKHADEVLEAMLSVAADPTHPLNSEHLHERLIGLTLPERDTSWSMQTYFAFEEEGALKRILRWAARGPHPECSERVAELALLAMAWTLSSPNRRLRDYATKAMVLMLASRLRVMNRLLETFHGVDDPYVVERLAAITHGAILCGGESRPGEAVELATALRRFVFEEERILNLVARDAVRGTHEWCVRKGLIDENALAEVSPPYSSAAPEEPKSEGDLEQAYFRRATDEKGERIRSEYASLFVSLFGMGDFGRYVVDARMRNFSEYPLSEPYPEPPDRTQEELEEFWAQLEASLKEEEVEKLGREPLALIDAITPEHTESLQKAVAPRPAHDPRSEYSGKRAACWIFERVLTLGWTPERFDAWEMDFVRPRAGRSGHKIERFGKKYQWIALSELLCRIADNFHMANSLGRLRQSYRGPWHFFGRDIDPTLPPAPLAAEDSREFFAETFVAEKRDAWWVPVGPAFRADDPAAPDDWASQTGDVPDFEALLRRRDDEGRVWVALQAYLNWDEEQDDEGNAIAPRRRDLWSHLKSWLVRRDDSAANVAYLKGKSFMNHWMPQGHEVTDASYLAEMPWSQASNEFPTEWTLVEGPMGETAPDGLELYPAWIEYAWEGSVWDCSIDSGVRAVMPSPLLFEAGSLRWVPGTTSWVDSEGTLAAAHHSCGPHSNLLVDKEWLARVLDANGWSLIVGWLGEKQLFTSNHFSPELVGTWTEFNGVAVFEDGDWTFHGPRFEEHTPAR